MTLILSGTDGLSDVDGSAATPAIRGTDANTGIFFPAADTIAFAEGGVEAMRLDSAGNMGLGVTPSASWGGGKAFVMTSGYVQAFTSTIFDIGSNSVFNGSSHLYAANGLSALYRQESGTHKWYNAASGTAGNTVSFTQAMTLDASGRLGIGQTSPQYPLHITGASGVNSYAHFTNATTGNTDSDGFSIGVPAGSADAYILQRETANLFFYTSALERARIDSSGNFTVGAAAAATNRYININGVASKAGAIQFQESGAAKWLVGNGAASENGVFEVYSNTTGTGVQLARNATSWAAGSDERIKDIIEPITDAATKVATLRAVIGKYKTDVSNTRRSFLIAQDVQAVLPEAVDDTNPEKLGVRYTEIIPLLVAAIQEQQAIITQLQADVAALQAK